MEALYAVPKVALSFLQGQNSNF